MNGQMAFVRPAMEMRAIDLPTKKQMPQRADHSNHPIEHEDKPDMKGVKSCLGKDRGHSIGAKKR